MPAKAKYGDESTFFDLNVSSFWPHVHTATVPRQSDDLANFGQESKKQLAFSTAFNTARH